MLPQPQNRSAISNGKTVDTWEKLPQTHCTWNLNKF